ncbi:hypothetical protein MRX96_022215 [Rhipicephalus microplus]
MKDDGERSSELHDAADRLIDQSHSLHLAPDQKAETDTSALDQAEVECQDSVAGDGFTYQHIEGTGGTSGGKELYDDGCWQTVLTVCRKKALAKAGKKLTTTEGD